MLYPPKLPSPVYVSLGVGPKSFERLVRFPGHLQLVDLYQGVAVFCDIVLYPERLCRPGIFLTIQLPISDRLVGDEQRKGSDLEIHDPRKE